MAPELSAPYEHLTFLSPLSESRADSLVAFLAGAESGRVIDLGCGWGELLLRAVAAAPHLHGLGYDIDAEAIARGERLADQRGLKDRVTLMTRDARDSVGIGAEAVICIGASQIWRVAGDEGPCDYAAALSALRAAVPRGGRVLYGEGVWSAPPTPRALAALGGLEDEFVDMAELADLAVAHGFMPIAVEAASLAEWDVFESGFSAAYAEWLAANPRDHPDAPGVRASAERQRSGYLRGYRGVLGFAYLSLVAV